MKKKLIFSILFLAFLPILSLPLHSQEKSGMKSDLTLRYLKKSDDKRILQTTLTYISNRQMLPLTGAEISVSFGSDRGQLPGKVMTDDKGIAMFEMKGDVKTGTGNEGILRFTTKFSGNDTIAESSSELTVMDLKMELILSEVDSIRTITVKAFSTDGDRERPASGETVKVYVPRMFSLLPVGDLTLDDSGSASVEFPKNLPGDKEGNVVVIARIEENTTYGNVEKTETIKWGSPTDYSVPVTHRALWTSIAPRWMIYTLSVLLIGVWGHYLYAIICLIRIKIDAKRIAKKEYRA